MQKYHDEPKQYKGYLKSALVSSRGGVTSEAVVVSFVDQVRGTFPPVPDHRMLDYLAPWNDSPCGRPGSQRARSFVS